MSQNLHAAATTVGITCGQLRDWCARRTSLSLSNGSTAKYVELPSCGSTSPNYIRLGQTPFLEVPCGLVRCKEPRTQSHQVFISGMWKRSRLAARRGVHALLSDLRTISARASCLASKLSSKSAENILTHQPSHSNYAFHEGCGKLAGVGPGPRNLYIRYAVQIWPLTDVDDYLLFPRRQELDPKRLFRGNFPGAGRISHLAHVREGVAACAKLTGTRECSTPLALFGPDL